MRDSHPHELGASESGSCYLKATGKFQDFRFKFQVHDEHELYWCDLRDLHPQELVGSEPGCCYLKIAGEIWSGRRDLHPRYPAPKAGVLAATLRPDGNEIGAASWYCTTSDMEVTRVTVEFASLTSYCRTGRSARQGACVKLAGRVGIAPT